MDKCRLGIIWLLLGQLVGHPAIGPRSTGGGGGHRKAEAFQTAGRSSGSVVTTAAAVGGRGVVFRGLAQFLSRYSWASGARGKNKRRTSRRGWTAWDARDQCLGGCAVLVPHCERSNREDSVEERRCITPVSCGTGGFCRGKGMRPCRTARFGCEATTGTSCGIGWCPLVARACALVVHWIFGIAVAYSYQLQYRMVLFGGKGMWPCRTLSKSFQIRVAGSCSQAAAYWQVLGRRLGSGTAVAQDIVAFSACTVFKCQAV